MIAHVWNVLKNTLQQRLNNQVQSYKHASGLKPVLSEEREAEFHEGSFCNLKFTKTFKLLSDNCHFFILLLCFQFKN